MTIKVTLSDDVGAYLEEQSLAQNKSCDQIAEELLRRAIASGPGDGDEPKQGETRIEPNHSTLNPEIEGKRLNQVLDELYIEDYLEKARR